MKRVVSLDLLRGLAAWTVAVAHFFAYHELQPKFSETVSIMAVEIFFVLSGYVLASQILLCLAKKDLKTFLIFLTRRWMRTVPGYIIALIVISVLIGELGSRDFFRYSSYVQNLFRQSNQADYFSVAWSLSVEEWFYIIFPGILLLNAKFMGRDDMKSTLTISVLFLITVAIARAAFGDFDNWGTEVRRVVVFRVDAIAYGFVLYLLIERVFPRYFSRISVGAAAGIFLAATILVFRVTASAGAGESILAKHLFPWLAMLFGTSCVLLALKMEGFVTSRRWLTKSARFGGRISYSVYLFHSIFLIGLGSIQISQPVTFEFVVYMAAIALFAASFYWTFEKPILFARPSFRHE